MKKISEEFPMSKLMELEKLGQSVWFDYIRRSLITSGELQALIDKGVRGITSNPAIFEKAITELIGAGVNVNVTLIFGLENYKAVADAYLAGLEKLLPSGPSVKGGHPVNRVASVASFFVSRVDSAVDKALDEANAKELQGKIAIANSKVAYAEFKKIFNGPRWQELKNKGARVQRVLWASTSAKNPNYPDTLYVDELIGPQTVNTLPPATVVSFIDHGIAAETLTLGVDEAHRQIEKLKALGIDLNAITQKLQDDGVIAFAKPFDALMQSLTNKRDCLMQPGAEG
jgi:transaldolase